MNVPLVESLVQVILSLSPEERALLEERLHCKTNWRKTLQQIDKLQAQIKVDRGGKPLDLPVDEIIHQMREEGTEELMRAGFPESEEK
jgi:beta-glucosidase-like glycosyl hydrolase